MRHSDRAEARRNTNNSRSFVRLRLIFVAVLLLLLADAVIWAGVCWQLERGLRDGVDSAAQNGWSLTAERQHWGGWPFAAAINLNGVSVRRGTPPGFVWQAERARVELGLAHPTTLTMSLSGAQSFATRGMATVPARAARTVIEADLTGRAPLRLDVDTLQAGLPAGELTLQHATATLPTGAVDANLTGVSWPGVATPIEAVRVQARIVPPAPQAATAEAGALAWRQVGGRIEIASASIRWDRLDATGSGTIRLDQRLQPIADGTVTASGLPLLLDDLARAGALAPAQASAAKAVIAVLAAPSGGNQVQLPVALEDGVLRLARFPLLRVPPIVWR